MNLETYPWNHIVTDSLIHPVFAKKIADFSQKRISDNKFGYAFWDDNDLDFQLYRENLKSKLAEFLELLPCRQHNELHLIDHLTINPQGYIYPNHCEHPSKIISIVTYIYPNESIGTKLYTSEHGECIKEIKWSPGTSLIFAGENNVTWHSYCSKETEPRVTLCSFFVQSVTEFNMWKNSIMCAV